MARQGILAVKHSNSFKTPVEKEKKKKERKKEEEKKGEKGKEKRTKKRKKKKKKEKKGRKKERKKRTDQQKQLQNRDNNTPQKGERHAKNRVTSVNPCNELAHSPLIKANLVIQFCVVTEPVLLHKYQNQI